MLVSLKRAFPGAAIDWLVQDTFAPAVAAHPDLSRVVPFPRSRLRLGSLWRAEPRRVLRGLLRDLREARYDLVFDCQGLSRSGFFAWATSAPVRVGFANAAELGWLGLNRRIHVPREMHTVDRMLALVRQSGVHPVADLRLYTPPEDQPGLDERLAGARYGVVASTSRWPGKRWPNDRFAEVVRALLDRNAVERVAVVGAGTEREQCGPVLDLTRRDPRVVDLLGRTGVGALMGIIEKAAIVLANDSAALHMAVGFERPFVGLYGPTRVDLVGPYGREHDVIQAATPGSRNRHKNAESGRRAMEAITTAQVADAVMMRLSAPSPAAARPRQANLSGV